MRSSAAALFPGSKVVGDEPIEQYGRKGREFRIESATRGVLRTRYFWVGRNVVSGMVTYKPQSFVPQAADYFLRSLQIDQ
jgi:hypothetical protein